MHERMEGPLGEAIEIIESIAHPLITFNLYLSFFSIVINILHLFILTRKSIFSISINTLMIGIAISDIFTLFFTIEKHFSLVDIESNECISSNSLLKVYIDMLSWVLHEYFRRCSTWLALSLAAVRALIVKNTVAKSNQITVCKPKFGKYLVVLIFILSSFLSIFYFFRFNVQKDSKSPLPISCEEFQDIYFPPKYTLNQSDLFSHNHQTVLRGYLMVDAVLSKLIPCISFPILTGLLKLELRKAKKKSNVKSSKNGTTRLVIFTTIAFFLAEAPLGLILMIRAFFHTHDSLIIASVDVIIVFTCLLTVNSTCHFFFCMVLSVQYRKTFFGLIGIKMKTSGNWRTTKVSKSEATRNISTGEGPYLGNVCVK